MSMSVMDYLTDSIAEENRLLRIANAKLREAAEAFMADFDDYGGPTFDKAREGIRLSREAIGESA